MTSNEAANEILRVVSPIFRDGVIFARHDLGVFGEKPKPYQGRLVRPQDTKQIAAHKLLQVLSQATDSDGSFYIIQGDKSNPYQEPNAPTRTPTPRYHPPGERRYWDRSELAPRNV